MTIYVDEAIYKRSPAGRKLYCHMIATTTLDDLHAFAKRIGVKKHFFHRARIPHYDLTSDQRATAIAIGAYPVPSKELVVLSKFVTLGKTAGSQINTHSNTKITRPGGVHGRKESQERKG